jgi:hypothetical protein
LVNKFQNAHLQSLALFILNSTCKPEGNQDLRYLLLLSLSTASVAVSLHKGNNTSALLLLRLSEDDVED